MRQQEAKILWRDPEEMPPFHYCDEEPTFYLIALENEDGTFFTDWGCPEFWKDDDFEDNQLWHWSWSSQHMNYDTDDILSWSEAPIFYGFEEKDK